MPFTLEGTTTAAPGTSNGLCTASLVLGILSLVIGCMVVPAILAIILGIVGYRQASQTGNAGERKKAIAGIVCAGVGVFFPYVVWPLLR
jgi:hypothetical membrane protein